LGTGSSSSGNTDTAASTAVAGGGGGGQGVGDMQQKLVTVLAGHHASQAARTKATAQRQKLLQKAVSAGTIRVVCFITVLPWIVCNLEYRICAASAAGLYQAYIARVNWESMRRHTIAACLRILVCAVRAAATYVLHMEASATGAV
jgi:hypothetical protein